MNIKVPARPGLGGGRQGRSCDKCSGPAAYTRRYSGSSLCTACFIHSIERKAAKTISKYGMVRNGDRVAVAVSGGKDSLALLRIMHAMSQTRNFEIVAVTIDEGIPRYRDEALGIVSDVCSSLGVSHKTYAYKDLFEMTLEQALDMRDGREKMTSCSICGTLRRRALDLAARDVGADSVATGHNLDDMLQTFLINMLSGDTDKIAWMNPGGSKRPRRIKPFCEIYEAEIVFYAFACSLPFQQEPCPHMNEGIRTEVREFLNALESGHSGIKNSMYASVLRMIRMAGDPEVGGRDIVGTMDAETAARAAMPRKQRRTCVRCGADCTGDDICAVCETILKLVQDHPRGQ